MSKKTILVCDQCSQEATRAGVGEGDIVAVRITCSVPKNIWWDADLCSDCQTELEAAIAHFMGKHKS